MSDEQPIIYQSIDEMPDLVVSQGSMLWNKTGSWRYLRPKYQNQVAPCSQGCPAGNDIEGFIRQIGLGNYQKAWQILKEENPFPKVCGRVCYHPCETVCNRSELDHGIAINALERFAAEYAPESPPIKKIKEDSGKKVAIVGSGPAGLTAAYHLARMGHFVQVFEAGEKPGGLLRYGIPDYRLPKEILDAEIDDIRSLGVKISCRKRIGNDVQWTALKKYDAVFLGLGVHQNRKLNLVGENSAGVISGLDFLGAVTRKQDLDLGKKIIIIGGGNSAIDSARCAVRLGNQVQVFYHRSRNEMPAFEDEIYEAERESVKIHFLNQPVQFLTENGKIAGVQFRKTFLGEPDESGRKRPIPIEGSEFNVNASAVITAVGESADLSFLPPEIQIEQGRIAIDRFGLTHHPGVFAGGDAALQIHNVAYAIGSGKAAACAIDSWLSGNEISKIKDRIIIGQAGPVSITHYLETGLSHPVDLKNSAVVPFSEININYFEKKARRKIQKSMISERSGNFSEISSGFNKAEALEESERCFHCGACINCDNCYLFCPDAAVTKTTAGNSPYEILFDYCKGCGICVNECPRSAMAMEEEK